MHTDIETRVGEILDQYSTQHADVAWLLCDRHPLERVALTVTELKPLLKKMSTTRARGSSRRAAFKRWRGRVLIDLSPAVFTPVIGTECSTRSRFFS